MQGFWMTAQNCTLSQVGLQKLQLQQIAKELLEMLHVSLQFLPVQVLQGRLDFPRHFDVKAKAWSSLNTAEF